MCGGGGKWRQQVKKISLQKSCKAPKRGPDANDQEGRRKRRRRKKTPTKGKYMPRAYLRKGTPRPHCRYYYCYCYQEVVVVVVVVVVEE